MKLTDKTRQELLDFLVKEFKEIAELEIFDPERIDGHYGGDFTEESAKNLINSSGDLQETTEGFWKDMENFRKIKK